MKRHCQYCGFNNPPDVGDCLYCRRSLPTTFGQVKETLRNLRDIASGNVGSASQHIGKNIVAGQVSSLAYRFHPVWFLKRKLHGLKKALINFLWVIGIIGLLVLIGYIYTLLGGKL